MEMDVISKDGTRCFVSALIVALVESSKYAIMMINYEFSNSLLEAG